jgi:hypothetical protein
MMCGILTIRGIGKYMKLLTLLAMLSTPGSGTVFDPTTIHIVVDIPLTELPLPREQKVVIL